MNMNKYDKVEYSSSLQNFGDYISNKYDNVHSQLYESALSNYLDSIDSNNDKYKDSHTFIEIKNDKYYLPSKVIIKSLLPPFESKIVDLTSYWNKYEYTEKFKNFNEFFFEEPEDINAFEVIYIDYVKGKVKFKNKNSGKIIWKDFSFTNEDTNYNLHEIGLIDTFSYKLQNKIYGE